MSIQEIRYFGDPVLTTPASPVVDFDKELRVLVKDLTETMLDATRSRLSIASILGLGFVWFTTRVVYPLLLPTVEASRV